VSEHAKKFVRKFSGQKNREPEKRAGKERRVKREKGKEPGEGELVLRCL
jgi:hypothetical protein